MTNLIGELKNEHHRKPNHVMLEEVYRSLQALLSRAEFGLKNAADDRNTIAHSYLFLQKEFNKKFQQLCIRLDRLLDFGDMEPDPLTRSLLVVAIAR